MRILNTRLITTGCIAALCLTACSESEPAHEASRPSLAPATQPASDPLRLDSSSVQPMYTTLLAIDLPAVMKVAAAQNIDIERAKQNVVANRGRYEASVENIAPVIAPSFAFEHLEGVNRAVTGQAVAANFNSYLPAIAAQWVLNPGKVIYDIIASKKRLQASQQDEKSIVLETTRAAGVQYYELVLAQTKVQVARQAELEAEELIRIETLRLTAGTGLPADQLRAQAALSARQQDLALALNAFYQASINLSLILHLDASVTLVPSPREIPQTTLVREDLTIEQLLDLAMQTRPDLAAARSFAEAAGADRSATLWGGIGPQLQAGYQYGGLATHVSGQNSSLHEQQHATASVGWNLALSTFGQMKTAGAVEQQSLLDVQRRMDEVRAQVVRSSQDSKTSSQIVPIARQQLDAASEALRLAQANLAAGTMLTLDVLQAEDAVNEARLRYASAVARYNQAQINLLAAVGRIDASQG
ncbi:MAG TPA: TolC family protein [Humisphaera sp.]|jgi:outer membrane protein TolC|nr:TolC family protein [Humisphaera sp.]